MSGQIHTGRLRWGRIVGVLLALALILWIAVAGVRAVVGLFRGDPCSVTVGSRTVDLSADQAEAAALAVVRRPTTASIAKAADLSSSDAGVVWRALTGRSRHALTCTTGGGGGGSAKLSSRGLTARAEAVRAVILRDFPHVPLGGYAPGGVHTGHQKGSAHYEGRAIDAFVRPISAANKQRGWALAQYLVARADRLHLATVIFDGWIWTHDRADEGWRRYVIDLSKTPKRFHPTLMHRDHVHVDVPR